MKIIFLGIFLFFLILLLFFFSSNLEEGNGEKKKMYLFKAKEIEYENSYGVDNRFSFFIGDPLGFFQVYHDKTPNKGFAGAGGLVFFLAFDAENEEWYVVEISTHPVNKGVVLLNECKIREISGAGEEKRFIFVLDPEIKSIYLINHSLYKKLSQFSEVNP